MLNHIPRKISGKVSKVQSKVYNNNNAIFVNYFLALFIQPLFFFCYVQTKYQIITESPDLQLPFHLIGLAIKALLPNNSSEKEKRDIPL